MRKQNWGFTLVELMVVMGLIGLLFLISVLSLSGFEKESQLDTLASEIKISISQAQSQTVNGSSTGVYFETHRFVSFSGETYLEGDPQNQETLLPSGIIFDNINLPSNTISFHKISGYVKNFTPQEGLGLLDQGTGRQKQITINKLGVVEIL